MNAPDPFALGGWQEQEIDDELTSAERRLAECINRLMLGYRLELSYLKKPRRDKERQP